MFIRIILLGSLPFMVNGETSTSGNFYLSEFMTAGLTNAKEAETTIGESFFACNEEEKCPEVVNDATHEKSTRWMKKKVLHSKCQVSFFLMIFRAQGVPGNVLADGVSISVKQVSMPYLSDLRLSTTGMSIKIFFRIG